MLVIPMVIYIYRPYSQMTQRAPSTRRMELLGNLIVLASSLVCLAASGAGAWSEARSAIAVTHALSVCGLLNWTVRTIA